MARKRPNQFIVRLSLILATTLTCLVLFTSIFEVWLANAWTWIERMAGATFP